VVLGHSPPLPASSLVSTCRCYTLRQERWSGSGWILNARALPGNVSQGSVFWVPPLDITKSDPNQQFEIQLWDLESQMGCSSPVFRFAEINESDDQVTTTAVPYGPFVTTAISIIGTGYVTATATVATYQSDTAQFDQAITGSITATDGAATSGTVASTATSSPISSPTSPAENDSRPSNTVAIAVGTVGGVLAVALVILSILLWRARRKQASEKTRARTDSAAELKETSSLSAPESQRSPAAEVSGDTARHEMMGSSTAVHELPSQNMEPVELAADEIAPPNYPGHGDYAVSPTSGELRRSLSFDTGTFTVSPLSAKRDRKE
jgi:hypothetical protein